MKPVYKIVLVVIALVLVGFLGYFLWTRFFTPSPTTTQQQPTDATGAPIDLGGGTSQTSGATSTTSTQGIVLKKLSDAPIFSFWVSKNSNTAFYLTTDGAVMQANESQDIEVSKQRISGVISAEPSPSGDKALVSFGDPNAPQWAIFDSTDKVWRPLSSDFVSVSWAGTEDKLIGVIQKNGTPVLASINLLKAPYEATILVNNFTMKNVSFFAKSPSEILISERPSALYNSRVWQLDTKTKILTLMLDPSFGMFLRWGSNRDIAFKFASPNKFSILNRSFSDISPLVFPTFPGKCDGGTDVAFCFVPQDGSIFSGSASLPDDYFMNKFYTVDSLHRVDLRSGNDSVLLVSNSDSIPAIDADSVIENNSSIYFINKYDNYLYVVQQPQQEAPVDY